MSEVSGAQSVGDDGAVELVRNPYYGAIQVYRDDTVISERVRQGLIWEPHLVEEFERHIRPGSDAIDVGANIGLHSIAMTVAQPEVGRVLAFEPHPQIFPVLQANIFGRPKIKSSQQAVGHSAGVAQTEEITHWYNPAGARVRPLTRLERWLGKGDAYRVPMVTLDSLGLRDVSLIKIDVEGLEMEVIRGASRLLTEQHPALIVEIWNLEEPTVRAAKIDTICAFGYAPVPISRIDTLFLRRD